MATPVELAAINRREIGRRFAFTEINYSDAVIGASVSGAFRVYQVQADTRVQELFGARIESLRATSWTSCTVDSIVSCATPSDPGCLTCDEDARVRCTCGGDAPYAGNGGFPVTCTGEIR
jgi:hypothetical protein